ncbi:uncharacterized protein PAE49_004768 isoform 1-T1 [Odontesthes bonariensis]|uniref:uncharacterized protein LOC142379468 isoform X1 n=2 Tax=Odontesthes bonariensis TaxID=219752 RepID=UPI003F58B78A
MLVPCRATRKICSGEAFCAPVGSTRYPLNGVTVVEADGHPSWFWCCQRFLPVKRKRAWKERRRANMEEFEDIVLSVLEAASIDEEALKNLSRDDLKDLFPGPENFLRRKKLWDFINQKCESRTTDQDASTCSGSPPSTSAIPPSQPQTSSPISETADKTVKLPEPPQYVLYTDSELDMVCSQYFALLRSGKEKDCKMSKELCCRLIRNTITSMVAILRASPMGEEIKYPSKVEMRAMAQKIVNYYPMLRDDNSNMPYVTIYTKMHKRLQNMRSPRKRQGSMPQRGSAKKTLFRSTGTHGDISGEASSEISDTSGSSADTVLLESNDEDNSSAASPLQLPSSVQRTPNDSNVASPLSSNSSTSSRTVTDSPTFAEGVDSLKMQARHYRTLNNLYKKPNARPNYNDVAQILDLEFQARRAFIDKDFTREEERPTKIFEAYPCFKDIRNAMDELRRIVDSTNRKYTEEMKGRWAEFCAKVQFYGVWKKVLKPPFPLDIRGAW